MTRRGAPLLAAALALTLSAASRLRAQEYRADESRHGSLRVDADATPGTRVLPIAERRAALSLAGSILDVLRRDSAIAAPVGYTVNLRRIVAGRDTTLAAGAMPYSAGVAGAYWGYFLKDGKPDPDASGKTPISVYANTLTGCSTYDEDYQIEDRGKPMLDGGPPILTGLRQTGEFRGHPIYDAECVVMTNRPEPLYLPVTRERYMRLEILGMRAKVARTRKEINYEALDAKFRALYDSAFKVSDQMIAARQATLDAMSPSERAAPAAIRHNDIADSTLAAPGDPDAVRLITLNPAFFDRTLPASKAQIIIVDLPFVQSGIAPAHSPDEPERRAHGERIRDHLDWAALETMVRP